MGSVVAAGFLVFLFTLGLSVWAFVTKFTGNAIPGWASTVLPIYFLGGVQLMFLGLIGEYLGKMYLEVKGRPLYIVKEQHNFAGAGETPSPVKQSAGSLPGAHGS